MASEWMSSVQAHHPNSFNITDDAQGCIKVPLDPQGYNLFLGP